MGHFYAALKRGMSRAEALHRAQIALLTSAVQPQNANVTSRSSVTDPYYWAPFVLVGNGL